MVSSPVEFDTMAAVPEAMEGPVIEVAEECPGVMPSTSGVVVVHSPPWAQDTSARPRAPGPVAATEGGR